MSFVELGSSFHLILITMLLLLNVDQLPMELHMYVCMYVFKYVCVVRVCTLVHVCTYVSGF